MLLLTEINTHNAIENLNSQKQINNHFNEKIACLNNTFNNKSKKLIDCIEKSVGWQHNSERQFYKLLLELEIKENIKYLILDIVLTSRLGILSTDIFSETEFDKNNKTIIKLAQIRLEQFYLSKNTIILIIEIPNFTNLTYRKI